MKIKDIFYINQGHQITDEEIYNSKGEIPIYTSANIIKGYSEKSLVSISDLPCISYQTKGFSGIISIQNELFEGNNTAVLILKEEYKNKINLEFVILYLKNIFKVITTSNNGVSYLNKDIVSNIDVDFLYKNDKLLDVKYQNNIVSKLKNLKKISKKFEDIKNNYIDNYELYIENFVLKKMKEITLLNKGSNKISEEEIYKNYDENGIPVYSSATENDGLMGKVKKEYFDNFHKKGYKGELTWTTNGYAGVVFYRGTNYIYSEKCGRIVIREEFKDLINSKYLKIYLNQITYKYRTSESNNGKLDIIHMENIPIKLPIDNKGNISIIKQNEIVRIYSKFEKIKYEIDKINKKINEFLEL